MTTKRQTQRRQIEPDTLHCPECGSGDIVRHGYTVTKKFGRRQRFFCNKCAHTFNKDEVVK